MCLPVICAIVARQPAGTGCAGHRRYSLLPRLARRWVAPASPMDAFITGFARRDVLSCFGYMYVTGRPHERHSRTPVLNYLRYSTNPPHAPPCPPSTLPSAALSSSPIGILTNVVGNGTLPSPSCKSSPSPPPSTSGRGIFTTMIPSAPHLPTTTPPEQRAGSGGPYSKPSGSPAEYSPNSTGPVRRLHPIFTPR